MHLATRNADGNLREARAPEGLIRVKALNRFAIGGQRWREAR